MLLLIVSWQTNRENALIAERSTATRPTALCDIMTGNRRHIIDFRAETLPWKVIGMLNAPGFPCHGMNWASRALFATSFSSPKPL